MVLIITKNILHSSFFILHFLLFLEEIGDTADEFVAETATEAVVGFAIFAVELDEGLGIGGGFTMHSSFQPSADDAVGFGFLLLKEMEGTLAEFLQTLIASIGKKERCNCVDDKQILGSRREVFLR